MSALRLGLCGSNFQGKWTTLQVCPPAPLHPHLGTPLLLQRGVGAVLEEGKEGGRHDPELSRSQEMSPKRSRGSCIQVLCSVCRNSQHSILNIPGTARSHVLVPASALGQGQRGQRTKSEPTRMAKRTQQNLWLSKAREVGERCFSSAPGCQREGGSRDTLPPQRQPLCCEYSHSTATRR